MSAYPNYVDYRDQTDVFESISARVFIVPVSLGGGEPERVWGQIVTANYFDVLGLHPVLGRGFLSSEDEAAGRDAVVVLSDGLWQRRFGGDPNILGQSVVLNNRAHTVVGVMPPGFHGEDRGLISEFWAPLSMYTHLLPDLLEVANDDPMATRKVSWLSLTGRLKQGVSREQAQAAVNVVKDRIDSEHNPDKLGKDPMKLTKAGGLVGGAEEYVVGLFVALMAVVGLVLLIACANVANILLARAAGRQKEISIRLAVGASRGRLVRQLLTESVLLASLGAGLGVLLAYLATQAISGARLPLPLPLRLDFTPDARVLAFTVGLTVLTGILFGAVPALRATKPDLVSTLKDETGSFGKFRRFGLRQVLVATQVALSVILLVSAGLFLRSLQNASSIDLGMRPGNLLLMAFDPKLHNYTPEQSRIFIRNLRQRVSSLPGVQSVSFTDFLPLSIGSQATTYKAAGGPDGEVRETHSDIFKVGSHYFKTIGTRLVRGREIDPAIDGNRNVAVINQVMAERLFPSEDPIGRTIKDRNDSFEVVGIVENAKSRTLGEALRPCVYQSLEQNPNQRNLLFGVTLLVKTSGDPKALTRSVRQQFQHLDRNLAVFNIETMQEHVNKALLIPRLSALLLGIFGTVGLTLAAVGLYGVMSYSVRRRTREIGIRMALGAPAAGVLRMVVKQGMVVAMIGLAVGLAATAAVGRLYSSFLYGVSPYDAITFIAMPAILLVIALVSTLIPALRASRVHPWQALRHE
jgi:predicted permease